MSKIKRFAILISIVFAWFLFAFLLYNHISKFNEISVEDRITSSIELAGYLFFISHVSYSNISWIFTMWKKATVYLANPSVSWKMTTIYNVNQIDENLNLNIFNDLNDKYTNFKFPDYYNNQLTKYEIIVNENKYLLTLEKPDEYEVRVTSDYRISYRNSLRDLYSNYSEIEQIIRSNFIHPTDISYLLKISLDGFNPFYKIYLNNFVKVDNINFSMKYELDNSTVHVINNKISIQSNSISQIKSISKDYIAISTRSLFN